jgi:hypothetical protein
VNADIPYLRVWVDNHYTSGLPGVEEGYAFGILSYPGRCLAWHVMLASGAHWRGLPIHALATRPDAERRELRACQLWDCFSFSPVVHVFQYLADHEAICYTPTGNEPGQYLFTVDWLPDSLSRPGWVCRPEQSKCGHVLELACGRLVCLPSNRVAWRDGYFCGDEPDPKSRGYRVTEDLWQAEAAEHDAGGLQQAFWGPMGVWPGGEATSDDRASGGVSGPLVDISPVCEQS